MAGKPKLYKTSLTIYWINVTETRPLESTVSSGAISKQIVVPTCCRVQGELPIFCAERTRSVSLKVKLADSSQRFKSRRNADSYCKLYNKTVRIPRV